jgi:undecaprenyl-phosphate 4-deoxy-4-formamido-L-arabinose transferase
VTTADPAARPSVSVVVPAYRSNETLRQLADQLDEHVAPLVAELEIVFVDDGSGAATWATIADLAATRHGVRGIRLARNYGQHNALLAGIRAARFPLVVTMDDDLQHPPSQVPRLLDAMTPDVDLVYGRPADERQSTSRNVASKLTKGFMSAALGPDVYPRSGAFRLFRRSLIEAADDLRDPLISIDVLLSWATTKIVDVTVDHQERLTGSSGYTLRGLTRHAMNMITGYSTRPLRWVSVFGLCCAALGFALLTFVIVRFIVGGAEVAGFTFLAAALTLFSGVQLLSLGVVGEYLGRVHVRTMGRPTYVVAADTANRPHETSADRGDSATSRRAVTDERSIQRSGGEPERGPGPEAHLGSSP